MPTFGQKLKELRKIKKKTQEEVANDLGMQRITYAQYEIDRREADYDSIAKLSAYFNVTTDYLLGRSDNPVEFNEEDMDFVHDLDLTDEEIMEKYNFNVDGENLTKEEIKEMLTYIRARRHMITIDEKKK